MSLTKIKTSMIDGSISGGTGVNFITDGDANNAIASIFVPYANAAGTRPVDGTGGSPTVTTSINSTNPISGTKDYKLIKPASNTQGQGWSIPFSVDFDYRTKSNKITASYLVESGTFVAGSQTTDSDVIVYLYDITNAILIEPSNIKLLSNSTTISDKYEATFQTSYVALGTASNYRLILHCASTSASAYTLRVDNISVSPQVYVYGTPRTDFRNQTTAPVITGSTSGTLVIGTGGGAINQVEVARDGDEVIARYTFRAGTSGFTDIVGALVIPFPIGYTPVTNPNSYQVVGYGDISSTATANPTARLIAKQFQTNNFIVDVNDTTNLGAGGSYSSNTNVMSIYIRFKAQGLSSSVQVSDGYEGRYISAEISRSSSSQSITATNQKIQLNGIVQDTVGAYDAVTNYRYTIRSAGDYDINPKLSFNAVGATGAGSLLLYKNGSAHQTALFTYNSAESANAYINTVFRATNCIVGDYFEIYLSSSTTMTLLSDATITGGSRLTITKVNNGSSTISASEMIACKYINTAGTSISNSGSDVIVPFASKVFDTHNAFNTDTFTCPSSGTYEITSLVTFTGSTYAAGNFANVVVYKNGSVDTYGQGFQVQAAVTILVGLPVTTLIDCKAGDTLKIYVNNNRTIGTTPLITTSGYNRIEIKRIK